MLRRGRGVRLALFVAFNLVVCSAAVLAAEKWASGRVGLMGSHVVDEYRLNHTWRPHGERLHREWIRANPDFPEPYLHVYNDRGWLETYDVTPEKPEGTYRIFYVGDSFTEGTVPMEESVPSRVEARLDELARGRDLDFEVINTGTSSYSPTIHYILTRYVLMEYDPDLIVVVVDMTDDFDDWKYSETLIRDADGNPWAAPPRRIYDAMYVDTRDGVVEATLRTRLELFLLQHSYIYNLVREHLRGRGEGRERGSPRVDRPVAEYHRWAWCEERWDEVTRGRVAETLDLVERLMRFAKSRGVRIMYTSVPHHSQYAGQADGTGPPSCSDRPHREIARVATANGVPYLDSFEALAPFVRGTPEGRYYYNGDIHFNPRGYEIWSRAHLDFLLDPSNGLLPERFFDDLPDREATRPARE